MALGRQALFLVLVVGLCLAEEPVHVHLAYGSLDTEMQVTFATYFSCSQASVQYGQGKDLSENVNATQTYFDEGNELGHHYIYNALLEGLVPGSVYNYVCSCDGDNTTEFFFTAKPSGADGVINLLVYGDMGRTLGPQALPALLKEVASGWPHAAIHIGDFAYDLDSADGMNGDIFFDQIEDIAAYIPYMVAVGNHESGHNYSQYLNRFNMPNTDTNMWFSWDISNVHFVVYSTEVYFDSAFSIQDQYEWLEQDLKMANAARNDTPWIIAYGHRPMYCSNSDGDDCTHNNSKVRLGLEELFYNYGVDIILEAHEHSYERLWPVYNNTVVQKNYDDPAAPVHIITGCAGCNEDLGVCVNPIPGPRGPWSAFHASGKSVYGYARMQIFNATHIYWEEIEVTSNSTLDSLWIVQNQHGPF